LLNFGANQLARSHGEPAMPKSPAIGRFGRNCRSGRLWKSGHPETATGGALAAQRSQHLLASPQMLRRTARVRRGYDRIMEDGT
jgi:hypothetical protein